MYIERKRGTMFGFDIKIYCPISTSVKDNHEKMTPDLSVSNYFANGIHDIKTIINGNMPNQNPLSIDQENEFIIISKDKDCCNLVRKTTYNASPDKKSYSKKRKASYLLDDTYPIIAYHSD